MFSSSVELVSTIWKPRSMTWNQCVVKVNDPYYTQPSFCSTRSIICSNFWLPMPNQFQDRFHILHWCEWCSSTHKISPKRSCVIIVISNWETFQLALGTHSTHEDQSRQGQCGHHSRRRGVTYQWACIHHRNKLVYDQATADDWNYFTTLNKSQHVIIVIHLRYLSSCSTNAHLRTDSEYYLELDYAAIAIEQSWRRALFL